MDMLITIINVVLALGTIALGAFGLFRPKMTMEIIGTAPTNDTGLAISEIRAASGGVWVGAAVGALLIGTPTAYVMLGALWAGATIGRGAAIVLDGANKGQPVVFFAVELVFTIGLLALNLPAMLA